nr:MAG TPA: hypothetical protein [Caudoviricetes sp.]
MMDQFALATFVSLLKTKVGNYEQILHDPG